MQTLKRNAWKQFHLAALAAGALFSSLAAAQTPALFPSPTIRADTTVKVSQHVYLIPDGNIPAVPNVGIIVGSRATLVVDTGLGIANGETILREVAKVSKNAELYVATTHYHPEHTTGGLAFPAGAKFIRARIQQQEMEKFGATVFGNFSKRNAEYSQLMAGSSFRPADILFEREHTLDLGGVRVRLSLLGPAHTEGDTAIFVEEDKVLFSGDLAMKRLFPAFSSPLGNGTVWLASLDQLDAWRPLKVIGAHGDMGDASLISDYRNYLKAVQARVKELKSEGKPLVEVSKLLTAEFEARHPDWVAPVRISGAVRVFYVDL